MFQQVIRGIVQQ